MIKIIITILLMVVGSLIYQTFLAEAPNYTQTVSMTYWSVITTVVFLINGIIKPKAI